MAGKGSPLLSTFTFTVYIMIYYTACLNIMHKKIYVRCIYFVSISFIIAVSCNSDIEWVCTLYVLLRCFICVFVHRWDLNKDIIYYWYMLNYAGIQVETYAVEIVCKPYTAVI